MGATRPLPIPTLPHLTLHTFTQQQFPTSSPGPLSLQPPDFAPDPHDNDPQPTKLSTLTHLLRGVEGDL